MDAVWILIKKTLKKSKFEFNVAYFKAFETCLSKLFCQVSIIFQLEQLQNIEA